RVLPSLGVEGVPVLTFHRWAVRAMFDLFPKLPTAVSEETPPLVSRVKNHPAMLGAIDAIAAEVTDRVDSKIVSTMPRWPEGDRVVAAWRATAGAPDRRLTALAQWLAGRRDIPGADAASTLPEVTRSALEALG